MPDKVIEHWFPSAEVAERCRKGWGRGEDVAGVGPWFALRPPALCRAVILCTLIDWPTDEATQEQVKEAIRTALSEDRNTGMAEVRKWLPAARILDPFCGRGTIPLEACGLGVQADGSDYAPTAALLAGLIARDTQRRDWAPQPDLPWPSAGLGTGNVLVDAADAMFRWIDRELEARLARFWPKVDHWGVGSLRPWAALWCRSVPCTACGKRTPMLADLTLRLPHATGDDGQGGKGDQGAWYEPIPDGDSFRVQVHEQSDPKTAPLPPMRRVREVKGRGKALVCLHCAHVMAFDVHKRLVGEGKGTEHLLAMADIVPGLSRKRYRLPTQDEIVAPAAAKKFLDQQGPFPNGEDSIVGETPPAYISGRRFADYRFRTYADMCVPRQLLLNVTLCRLICEATVAAREAGLDEELVQALVASAGAAHMRMLKFQTFGARLNIKVQRPANIFSNGGITPFGNDFIETGIADGPSTWRSISWASVSGQHTVNTLKFLTARQAVSIAQIIRSEARVLPHADGTFDATITDPPYDGMVEYRDSADWFHVWLKRSQAEADPLFAITTNPDGGSEYDRELIVKAAWRRMPDDSRNPADYDAGMADALAEARRCLKPDGIVTILFGHDSPEVWDRMVKILGNASLVLTSVWPVHTERGSQMGKGNMEATLTLTCRPAPVDRPIGQYRQVEEKIRSALQRKVLEWQTEGMSTSDIRVAAYAPALAFAGRYQSVCRLSGEEVETSAWLDLARRIATEQATQHVEEEFDDRTRMLLDWLSEGYGRSPQTTGERRRKAFAHNLDANSLGDLLPATAASCRLPFASELNLTARPDCMIDSALAVAAASRDQERTLDCLEAAGVDTEDHRLFALCRILSKHLPETDPDVAVWRWLDRERRLLVPMLDNRRRRSETDSRQTVLLPS